jgi:hypothetical protein
MLSGSAPHEPIFVSLPVAHLERSLDLFRIVKKPIAVLEARTLRRSDALSAACEVLIYSANYWWIGRVE